MPVLDRLFGRTRSGIAPTQGLNGVVRIGGAYYNAKWNFTRVLNEVYANPTGYRCVNTIVDDFSRPPWAIYSDESPDHPVEDTAATELLGVLNKPDKMLSGTAMQRHIAMDLELNGRSLWLQLRGKDEWGDRGPLTGLKRLACENATVLTNEDRDLLGFIYTTDAGIRIPLLPSEVIYLHYAHPQNPWEGFPPAYVAGLPANVDDRAMRFNWRLLENDGALPGYITVEGLEPREFQEFKAIWDAGADPGKVRFLKGGSTNYTPVGLSNKDMLYDKLRDMSKEDQCTAFGMSPLVINPSDATFSNGNQARVNYMSTKISSMWALVGDQFSTQIQDDYSGYRVGFNLSDIEELGEAKDDVVNRAVTLYEGGIVSDDEAREMVGYGPKSEASGEFYAATSLAFPTAEVDETDASADESVAETQKVAKAIEGTISKSLDWNDFDRKIQAYEVKSARKMKRFFDKQSRVIAATIRSRRGKSLQKALDGYFDRSRWDAELADEAGDMFSDVVDSFGTWTMANLPTAKKFDATHDRVTKYIQGRSTKAAGLVNDTTEQDLRAAIDDLEAQGLGVDDIAKGVEDYFAQRGAERSELWARTECIGASNFAALEGARQSGVVDGKSVLTASGADEDCTAAEAMGVLDLDDDSIDLPIHPNCRCGWLFQTTDGTDEEGNGDE